jgi:serine/threonine protein kinase
LFPGFADVHEIGVGSLAVVYRAREIGTNRQVALKLLNVRDASPRSIESFERESIALGALSSHPNIVTLYRTFRTPDGRPVLVLELCSGAVADRLHNGAGLAVTDAVSIGIKIAGALETAHRGGILHRDVKPQNILVTEFGEPALADFGVAMLQSSTQTTAGLFDFTTLHAAPELLEGGGTSAATDVYELASSLYQLIAGQSAFRAYEGESPASVILRILRDPVRPLSGAGVPIALSDLLIRAMSKEKDQRPPTAAEFAAELAEIEIAQGWNRTQFLVRGDAPGATGPPTITRMPDQLPRRTQVPPAPPTTSAPPPLAPPSPAAPLSPAAPAAAQPAPVAPAAAEAPREVEFSQAEVDPQDAWSTPTIVPSAAWTPPPAQPRPAPPAPPSPPAAAAPMPADQWWSPPAAHAHPPAPAADPAPAAPPEAWSSSSDAGTGRRRAAPPQQQRPDDWSRFAPPAPRPTADPVPPQAAVPDIVAPEIVEPEPAQPEPEPTRAWRVPVDIDDDYFPAVGPTYLARPEAARSAETAPHAEAARASVPPSPAAPDAVPVWAVRAPVATQPEQASPQFLADLSLDPMSLRNRATIRAGASSVVVDDQRLRLRTWFRRTDVEWADVLGFEIHLDTLDETPASTGHIVALTSGGPVEMPGTHRSLADLRYVHAQLEAYRIRARRLAAS